MYIIGAATCNVACCLFLCLRLRLRCCPLLQWVCTGLVLCEVGGCSAGMPGYAICPAAEWLLVTPLPMLLKWHRQFGSWVCYTNGGNSLLAGAGNGDALKA